MLAEEALEANDLLLETLRKYSRIVLKQTNGEARARDGHSYLIAPPSQSSENQNAFDDLKEIFSSPSTAPVTLNTDVLLPKMAPIAMAAQETQPKTSISGMSFLLDDEPSSSSDPFDLLKELKTEKCAQYSIIRNVNLIYDFLFSLASKIEREIFTAAKPTHSRLANFDSEMTELVSGLKINLKKDSVEPVGGSAEDDKMLDIGDAAEPSSSAEAIIDDVSIEQVNPKAAETIKHETGDRRETLAKPNQENVQKPLRELFVDLNSIEPHETFQPQCILDEPHGLKITLNFAKDRPRQDVAVLVLTTTNHNSQPISNYQFEASVSKVESRASRI